MKPHHILALAVAAACGFSHVSSAATWMAGADLAANEKPDGADDFINPNSTVPEWSYGYRPDITGTDLTFFTEADHSDSFIDANDPFEGFYIAGGPSVPLVMVNTESEPQSLSFGAGPIPALDMFMHGGPADFSVVRFTVPATGMYDITASFSAVHNGDADAHIVINGVSMFDEVLLPGEPETLPTFQSISLSAGDLVDFLVGINGSLGGDSVAFNATIETVNTGPIIPVTDNVVRTINGTATNPDDDTVSFSLNVSGETGSVSPAGWTITAPDVLAGTTGSYNIAKDIAGVPIAAFSGVGRTLVVVVADAGNLALTANATVTAPGASLQVTVSNVARQEGPTSDPGDDTWGYSVTINGQFTGTGWTSDNPAILSGAYSVVQDITNLSVTDVPSQTTIFADIADPSAIASVTVNAPPPPAQRVNIDFNGKRPGDTGSAGTYVGMGAASGGTFFNEIVADSTNGDDNLTVAGLNLLSDMGEPTTVGFEISPVGGDNEPAQSLTPASLYDDYIFNNSAGNFAPTGSPFTISGLGDALTADVYFYLSSFNSGTIEIDGIADEGLPGIYNGMSASAFFDVPVSNGNITGFFGRNGAVGVLAGLTVVTAIQSAALPLPEFTSLTHDMGTTTLTFTTTAGLMYLVEYSNNLSTWQPLGSRHTATGDSLTVTDTDAAGPQRYYRVIVSQ